MDENGKKVTKKMLFGKRTVLYFYPKAGTQGCAKEAQEFSENIQSFKKKGFQVIGVSPDSPKALKKFKEKYSLKVKLLSDQVKKLAKALGVLKENGGIKRSTFLLDEKGRILKEWRGVKVKGHVKKVLETIDKLF